MLYSLIVLILSANIFYFLSVKLGIQDARGRQILYKKEFDQNTYPSMKEVDIPIWNKIMRNRKLTPAQAPLVKDTVFKTVFLDTLVADNRDYLVLESPVIIEGHPYTYFSKVSLMESEGLIRNIVLLFVILVCLLLTGFYLLTRRLSRKLWGPFYETLDKIELFELDKTNPPVLSENDTAEFSRLNNSINKLIQKNIIIFQSQKEFIENAAHELQTPLAIFQSKFDTLIQRADLTEGQAGLLEKLNDGVARLNRVNKNLLLLSKIDNSEYVLGNLSLKDILTKQLEFFSEQAKEKNIQISFQAQEDAIVTANEALTEILVSNLILNAVRYNIPGGSISISLNKTCLFVSNTSEHPALSHTMLYKRFAKSNPSTKGSGLGLSIVKRIADLYKWKLAYTYDSNFHNFTVNFSEF